MALDPLVSLDPTALRCPYPLYAMQRDAGVRYEDAVGAFVVSSNALVTEVLRSPDRFSSVNTVGNPVPPPGAAEDPTALMPLLLLSDDPEHAERRSVVARAFTPSKVASWEEPVRELIAERIASLKDQPDIDVVRDISKPLPVRVITWVLGIPEDDVEQFRYWSEAITSSVGAHAADDDAFQAVQREFIAYMRDALRTRAADPQDDILTKIAQTGLPEHLQVRFIAELLVAGNITTTHHISSSLLLLARHSGMLERMRADRSLVKRFVEESLRLESPIQGFYRLATVDTEIGGTAIPAGSRVFVIYGSANRDPEMWGDSSAELDLERPNGSQHLAFGVGIHTCLGAPLARLEGRLVIESIIDQVASIELLVDPNDVEYGASFINRGITGLPMRFEFL
jgi:cytochrome P450